MVVLTATARDYLAQIAAPAREYLAQIVLAVIVLACLSALRWTVQTGNHKKAGPWLWPDIGATAASGGAVVAGLQWTSLFIAVLAVTWTFWAISYRHAHRHCVTAATQRPPSKVLWAGPTYRVEWHWP